MLLGLLAPRLVCCGGEGVVCFSADISQRAGPGCALCLMAGGKVVGGVPYIACYPSSLLYVVQHTSFIEAFLPSERKLWSGQWEEVGAVGGGAWG